MIAFRFTFPRDTAGDKESPFVELQIGEVKQPINDEGWFFTSKEAVSFTDFLAKVDAICSERADCFRNAIWAGKPYNSQKQADRISGDKPLFNVNAGLLFKAYKEKDQ